MLRPEDLRKFRSVKWLLNVFFILSMLTFSGSTLTSEIHRPTLTQTEVKISFNKKEKRTVSYQFFLTTSFTRAIDTDQFDAALWLYARIISSAFDTYGNASPDRPDKAFSMYYSPRRSIDLFF